MKFAGAEWLIAQRKVLGLDKPISPLGLHVADLLGQLFYGLYHWEEWQKVDWSNETWIRVTVPGDLATHDFNLLTRLVLLCHHMGIRASLSSCNFRYLEIIFHDRSVSNTHGTHPHPTIGEALARFDVELASESCAVRPTPRKGSDETTR